MGAWGDGPFDNAAAADFVGDLAEADDPGQVLTRALGSGSHQEMVAAACVVAARLDTGVLRHGDAADGEELTEWLHSGPFDVTDSHTTRAQEVLVRVLHTYSLWDDADAAERVIAALEPYRNVLRS